MRTGDTKNTGEDPTASWGDSGRIGEGTAPLGVQLPCRDQRHRLLDPGCNSKTLAVELSLPLVLCGRFANGLVWPLRSREAAG